MRPRVGARFHPSRGAPPTDRVPLRENALESLAPPPGREVVEGTKVEQIARDMADSRPRDESAARELLEQGCGLQLGRYTLLRKIAVGGMAEV
jgi:hypothetical protein